MTKVLLYELGQSVSFGRLSLLGKVLWPMLLASTDNQGRGIAEADVIKWHVCPNVAELTIDNIPDLLREFVEQGMVLLYQDGRKRELYQVLRWWDFQQFQYARPSRFAPPDGWTDRIRYTTRGQGQTVENWDHPGGFAQVESEETQVETQVESELDNLGRPLNKLNLTGTETNLTELNAASQRKGGGQKPKPKAKPNSKPPPPPGEAISHDPDPETIELWKRTRPILQATMTKGTFDAHIAQAVLLSINHHTAVLGVQREHNREWIEGRLLPTLQRALVQTLGREVEVECAVIGGSG